MRNKVTKPDPREMPAYSLAEAAHYLSLPQSTVRWWSIGRDSYPSLIEPAAVEERAILLSFYNLVELHLLNVVRREHGVKMKKVRNAIDYLKKRLEARNHPLLRLEMQTDGIDLFVDQLGKLVNISQDGQTAMRQILAAALQRIEWDSKGLPIKLYPFTRSTFEQSPSLVVIDPRLSGGRPVIAGTGLATDIIAERYKAGESVEELTEDYERSEQEIEEAIRCELQTAA